MNNSCINGLRWHQSNEDAIRIGKVFYVFNPEIYSSETLTKSNRLIKTCLSLWSLHGIENEKEARAVENLQRQYYNNQRRIAHYNNMYSKKIEELRKLFAKLSIY